MVDIEEITEQARLQKIKALPISNINCLDKGFVQLIDFMGTDKDIVESARVSYQLGTKKTSSNANLIDRLMRDQHTSAFEQVSFRFKVKAPIFVIIQLIRHRTAKINSESGRFSELKDEFYLPDLTRFKTQHQTEKQSSSDNIINSETSQSCLDRMLLEQKDVYENYQYYLSNDVARELSRINLPLSTYMNFVWKMDLHNLFHFLGLRLDFHAQEEIRVFAHAMYEIIKQIVPMACKSFEEHKLYGKKLGKTELEIIKQLVSKLPKQDLIDLATTKLKGTRLKNFVDIFEDKK